MIGPATGAARFPSTRPGDFLPSMDTFGVQPSPGGGNSFRTPPHAPSGRADVMGTIRKPQVKQMFTLNFPETRKALSGTNFALFQGL